MAVDPATVAQLLNLTLDPKQHKQAEAALKVEETKPGYSLVLLRIVSATDLPETTRLSGALQFKNFIRENYVDEEGNYRLSQDEVQTIKQEIVGLMLSVPPKIRTQVGEAISVIADSDFWQRWETLLPDLNSRLTADNAEVNNGVLEVAHTIFKRWRPLFRSDALYNEILHALNVFGEPSFMNLLTQTDQLIDANKDNKEALISHVKTMILLIQIFFDLSCQDIPALFENQTNLPIVSRILHKYLTYNNPLLETDDESESGQQEFLKAAICEALVLYVQKYDDVFGPFLPPFVESAWTLLTTIGLESKYDILVSKALGFLTAVAQVKEHAQSFNNEVVMKQVVEKVVLPNVSLRESDIEQFEDEPIEYIRRDLEGSDSATRRRAATDFVQKLLEQFPDFVTNIVGAYVMDYLKLSNENPAENWKAKDTAVYLYSTIAARGGVTAAYGVKTINERTNVVQFFSDNIAQDLVTTGDVQPILKVDAIKYLYTFRSQLTQEQWKTAMPLLVQNLESSNYVVYTYTAIAVERVLHLTNEQGGHVFGKEDLLPLAKPLLEYLFKLIQIDPAPQKVQENEFLMRCVMRILIVIRESVVDMIGLVLQNLINITLVIGQNPSNPRFYYYHFEALGAVIKFAGPVQPAKLEELLNQPFANIIQNDISEFKPYIFQLFAALLEAHKSNQISDYYKSLIDGILDLNLWTIRGNVPALTRFLTALIPRAAAHIAENPKQFEQILVVFQELMTGRSRSRTELFGFDLIEAIVVSFPAKVYESFFNQILAIILTRLQNNPPEAYKRRFAVFYHLIASRDQEFGLGADFLVAQADSLGGEGNNIFTTLYLQFILPSTEQFAKPVDRKLAVVSFTKTLCDSNAFYTRYEKKGWGFTAAALLKILENPPKVVSQDDAIEEHDIDDVAFGVGFTQLTTCKKSTPDAWPDIQDVKSWVGEYLKKADGRKNGAVAKMVQEKLTPEMQAVLVSYMR